MLLYPFWFIFTLAYDIIALRTAINVSDYILVFISCAKGVCKQFICLSVNSWRDAGKLKKVVNAFHFQLHLLETKKYLWHLYCACMLLLFSVLLPDGFIGEFIICLPYFLGKRRRGREMITSHINLSLGECKIKSLVFFT